MTVREVIEAKYRSLFSTWSWSFSKYTGGFNTIADETSGTIAVTLGSTAVTGTSTNFIPSTGSFNTNSFIKISGQLYGVASVSSDTSLTLDGDGYSETSASGLSYVLFKPRYELADGVTHVTHISCGQYDLIEQPLSYINIIDPSRDSLGQPLYFSYVGMGSSGGRIIELYPGPNESQRVNYEGIKMGSFSLSSSSSTVEQQIVDVIFSDTMRECCRLIAMKDKETAALWLQLSGSYGEDYERAISTAAWKDLLIFGTPLYADSGNGIEVLSGEFAAEHDIESL